MKRIIYLFLLAGVLTACNDAAYSVLSNHAFISESLKSHSAKVIITETGAFTEITPSLSYAAEEDCSFKIVMEQKVLDDYNKKQGTSYVMLPDTCIKMNKDVTIKKGQYTSAPVKIKIKPLGQELIGESYAIPIRLVSYRGNIAALKETGVFVITTEAIVESSLPQFTGKASLSAAMPNGPETFEEYTIEVKFQVSNTNDRDRAVFINGGPGEANFVLLRFEDPQSNTAEFKKHSLVQIVGRNRIYMNPSASFSPDKWQHLALTCDGSHYKLYINGAFAGVKDIPAGPTTFEGFNWFTAGDSYDRWGGCKILLTEARIWSVCRTETQISKNQSTVSPKSKGLVAYWRFNEGKGNIFNDCTGNGHTITTSASPIWVPGIKSTDEKTEWK